MIHQLTIPGNPIAKKRPRFARRGKFVVTYNDQETEEGRFILDLRQQWMAAPITGPVKLGLDFIMSIPKSTSKKDRALMELGELKHTRKPDVDNLVKFVKDCCNQMVWVDDSQVYWLIAHKYYGLYPKTIIEIERS